MGDQLTEALVAARVLDALLREDYAGLRARVAGGRLELPTGQAVRLQACRPALLADRTVAPEKPLGLDDLLGALRLLADPRDDLDALARECRAEVTALRLLAAAHESVLAKLATADPLGPGTYYDTLAAYCRHPVHPMSHARPGLTEDQLKAYAPEFHPVFELRWAAVPRAAATVAGELPGWWPTPRDLGLTGDVLLFPVHPLTTSIPVAARPYLQVTPTLSMRTVSVAQDPAVHLKVPLPTSTLGLRNRRSIVPRTLADGAAVQRLLSGLLAGQAVLLADEQTYGHAGDPMLGFLVRRFPPETRDAHVLPVAALLATAPGGGPVIERFGDDVETFFSGYLKALFALSVPLFTRHGVALETHQQNLGLVLRDGDLKLLVKDNDGPLLHPGLPGVSGLADRRLVSDDREALARVFVTITLHLCAGAVAFGLAERGLLPLRTGLALVRDRLDEALRAEGRAGAFLRARTLDADRLPAKAMVTAGTLVGKDRTGAADINKHYGPPGPNYLRGIHT